MIPIILLYPQVRQKVLHCNNGCLYCVVGNTLSSDISKIRFWKSRELVKVESYLWNLSPFLNFPCCAVFLEAQDVQYASQHIYCTCTMPSHVLKDRPQFSILLQITGWPRYQIPIILIIILLLSPSELYIYIYRDHTITIL